jgi:hypothetical protein
MSTLVGLMPSLHQQESLQALFGLFLAPVGSPLPQHCQLKSAGALSRFLNHYGWPTRKVIRRVRSWVLEQLLRWVPQGRRPHLQLIVDLTTLEKTGKFQHMPGLVRWYNRKRGLHLVVLYLVVGRWRLPWGFRIYRGKGSATPVHLALRLLSGLPEALRQRYEGMVLADAGFSSREFLQGVRQLGFHALVSVSSRRCLADGRPLQQLHQAGQQVQLRGLSMSLTWSYYTFKGEDGRYRKRHLLCTRRLKASTLRWWGRRRWAIEGFFKVAKHRFGLHRFGQSSPLGVYRWLVLVLIAFVLALCGLLIQQTAEEVDWAVAAQSIVRLLIPHIVIYSLLKALEPWRQEALELGIELPNMGW